MTTHDPTFDVYTRDFTVELDRQEIDAMKLRSPGAELATIPIALSSEFLVERMDPWTDERYIEVLDHSPSAVDLSRAKDGLPFLDSHDAKRQLGIIENVHIGADKRLRGDVRFSRRQEAQDLKRDMQDGIRKQISVGYRIDPATVQKTERPGELTQKRITRWTPFEGSSVSIPADPTVGVGRSAGDAARPVAVAPPAIIVASARNGQGGPVDGDKDPGAGNGTGTGSGTVDPGKSRATWIDSGETRENQARIDGIMELAAAQGLTFADVREWVKAPDMTLDRVKAAIFDQRKAGAKKETPIQLPAVELTDREREQYSVARAVRALDDKEMNPHRASKEGSFEQDISDQLEKNFPPGIKRHGGILVPTFTRKETALEIQYGLPYGALSQRAGLDSATATKGTELKFTVPGEFLPVLRNLMATMKAGATMLSGLQGPVAFPAQTAAGTATWVGENAGSDVADSNLLLTQITLTPKSISSSTSYSRQLLAQSVIDVDSIVRMDLAAVIALALDLAGITGTGASNQPTGVINTAGIGSVALGTNGLTPVYTNLVDLETQVTAANADQWPLAYLAHPTTRGTFKKATVLANTVGVPVWQRADDVNTANQTDYVQGMDARVPGELNGYPAWASAQVPNALTKGTSTNCLAILFGAWSQLVYGDWGMYELIVDPYRLKKQGMIELTAFAMYGVAVKYPKAFAAILDALP